MMNETAIREVFSDENFVKGLFELETPEEVQQALRQKDISLSVAEIEHVRELLLKQKESGQELSEEELESVTGGIGVITLCIMCAIGWGAAAVGAGVVGAIYTDYKTNHTW